ncbi:MAG TPA: hypothetical protein VIV66_18910 [Pyrinomonadaceae bacterium]
MSDSEKKIERYLLGEMPEAEQTVLEQSYFNDRSVFEQVTAVESDLVDKYARGLLSPHQSARFEEYYMVHPPRRDRVRFAEALVDRLDSIQTAPPQSTSANESLWSRFIGAFRFPTLAWVAALLLLFVAIGSWLYVRNQQLRELAQGPAPEAARSQPTTGALANAQKSGEENERVPSEQPSPQPAPPKIHRSVTLALAVTGVRGGDIGPMRTLTIPSGTEEVKLELKLRENDYAKYQIVLQAVSGPEIFRQANLVPTGKIPAAEVVALVAAAKFAAGDYMLTLKGVRQSGEVEDISKSLFRVVKK